MTSPIQETCEIVSGAIIAALDAGTAPWCKPWTGQPGDGMPVNLTTGKAYTGVWNPMILMLAGGRFNGDNRWAGFNQYRQAGNSVRKGEQGTDIFFPMFRCVCGVPIATWSKSCKNGHPLKDDSGKEINRRFGGFDSCTVFNNQQTAAPAPTPVVIDVDPTIGFEAASKAVNRLGARVCHGGSRASYAPASDTIALPEVGSFVSPAHYWATSLHEHAHWTGHASRLNRPGIVAFTGFGTPEYAYEELIAEMGSAFACHHLGIKREGLIENHAAYIASWKKGLTEDPMVVRKAATEAGRILTFLMK